MRPSHPDRTSDQRPVADLLLDAARRGVHYRETLSARAVAPGPEALAALSELRTALPEQGRDPSEVIALLDRVASPATVAMAGGRYFGFVNGSSLPVASNWLATAWDQNCAMHVMSPAAATIESVALEWLLDVLRLPATSAGAFVVGATMANVTALAAARHAVLARVGWDVDNDGLFGAPSLTVVVGEEVHATVRRALGLLGLGRSRTVTLPVDRQGRMRADALPRLDGPTIVCIQAGNVNTGAVDPASEICEWAKDRGGWVHVDGAFGLWARATPTRADQANGYELADSWAIDAHKWLNVPYDCGMALVRDDAALRAAMVMSAAYLPESGPRDPMHYSPDGSRRALLPSRHPHCWPTRRRRPRDSERCPAESSAGRLRRRPPHSARDRRCARRWRVLVWRHQVAGARRDADQCLLVGHNRRGRGPVGCFHTRCGCSCQQT